MGQVPKNQTVTYGIVGDGRAAQHFARYLSLKNIPFLQASRSHFNSLSSSESFGSYVQRSLSQAEVILVLIADRAIEPLILEVGFTSHQKIVHFSGALSTPLATGWHPLMTFVGEPYELSVYESMGFVGETGGTDFKTLFPQLANPHFEIPTSDRARYHAFCVASGNFTNLLWNSFFQEFEHRWGGDREFIMPYLDQIMVQLQKTSLGESRLTGPLARGDQSTIEKNLGALNGHPLHGVYKAFVLAFAPQLLTHPDRKDTK